MGWQLALPHASIARRAHQSQAPRGTEHGLFILPSHPRPRRWTSRPSGPLGAVATAGRPARPARPSHIIRLHQPPAGPRGLRPHGITPGIYAGEPTNVKRHPTRDPVLLAIQAASLLSCEQRAASDSVAGGGVWARWQPHNEPLPYAAAAGRPSHGPPPSPGSPSLRG